MSAIEKDFDRLALLDSKGWTHNNHYHNFLLKSVPRPCARALEIGCGTGAFSRRLAEHAGQVLSLDLSPEMIRVARSRSAPLSNLEFEVADVMAWDCSPESFDCIVTIATLHHLPLQAAFEKIAGVLKPGGVLVVLDLFEPERNLLKPAGWRDAFLNFVAMGVSVSLRLIHNGRLRPPRAVRAAWEAHGAHDSYSTMRAVRALSADMFPGARVKQHLLWRYSLIWQKPDSRNRER
jgi:ubiquinone/menaquinone biosynthesis C-methylase UbiE